jgi:hypothetical protein
MIYQEISLEDIESKEKAIGDLYDVSNTLEHHLVRWADYNDTIGYDNIYVDNIALTFVQRLLTKCNRESKPCNQPRASYWRPFLIKTKSLAWWFQNNLRNHFLQNFGIIIGMIIQELRGWFQNQVVLAGNLH